MRRHRILVFWLAGFVCTPATIAMANRAGALAARNGSIASNGISCTECHGALPGNGSVSILGIPAGYTPGQTYNLSVRVQDPVQLGAGFEISAESPTGVHRGTLIRSDAVNTRFASGHPAGWITHTATGVSNAVSAWGLNGNSATFNLQWQAPAGYVGRVIFFAAGNAINNNMNNAGDIIYLTNTPITLAGCQTGDTNEDGDIDGRDVRRFVEVLLDPASATPVQICAADVNGDGQATVADITPFVNLLAAP